MHEMSIALSIIDVVDEQARKAEAKAVKEVEMDIGTMSGIEYEALEFALQAAVQNTIMQSSAIVINRIRARSECMECGHQFDAASFFSDCPSCKQNNTKLICGRELQVKSIVIE
ncbi:hydrogenase maturation nickel metallochaperone HypA [Bacteroidota bacterium]